MQPNGYKYEGRKDVNGHYSDGKIPPGISFHVVAFSQVNNSLSQHSQMIWAQRDQLVS